MQEDLSNVQHNAVVFSRTAVARNVDANQLANEIKRAYSGEVLKDAAGRFGWMLKETGERKWHVLGR